MRMFCTRLLRRLRSLSRSCRSRARVSEGTLGTIAGALSALLLGLGATTLVAQQTGGGVLPIPPSFSGGGVMSGPLQVTALGVGIAPGTTGTIRANNLTDGRVVLAGPNGVLFDDSGLVFNSTTDALTANGTITSGGSVVAASGGAFFFTSRTALVAPSDGVLTLSNNGQTDFSRLQFGGTTSGFPSWKRSGQTFVARLADDSGDTGVSASYFQGSQAVITAGAGTGLTVASTGQVQRHVYKAIVDRTTFVCAAVTCDFTIATLPAKTAVLSVYAELTQVFACTATCTSSTLSMILGRIGAGDAGFLASFDADAATGVFGDVDAEMGTVMTRAAAVQGGHITSFSATTAVVVRLTSGTGNIGNGSATNLSTGSVTFYVVTERMP